MVDVLGGAGGFIAIILLGYILRRKKFFKETDVRVLSKIILNITLPATIISNFAGEEMDPAILSVALISVGIGVLYIIIMFLLNIKRGKDVQAFEIVNTAGSSVGNFAMPFIQRFLGPVGVMTASIFAVGNSCISLGGSYSIAAFIKSGEKFSVLKILKKLSKSFAFDVYMFMIVVKLLDVKVPNLIASWAEVIGSANTFLVMLMIGMGFKLNGEITQIKTIVRVLFVRYTVALAVAIGCYCWLPFSLEVRQALVILAFCPLSSPTPAFTAELKGDVGLASAINAISIVCSLIFTVVILLIIG